MEALRAERPAIPQGNVKVRARRVTRHVNYGIMETRANRFINGPSNTSLSLLLLPVM